MTRYAESAEKAQSHTQRWWLSSITSHGSGRLADMRSVIPGASGRNCPGCGLDVVVPVPIVELSEVTDREDLGFSEASVLALPFVSWVLSRSDDGGCETAGVLGFSGVGADETPLDSVSFCSSDWGMTSR